MLRNTGLSSRNIIPRHVHRPSPFPPPPPTPQAPCHSRRQANPSPTNHALRFEVPLESSSGSRGTGKVNGRPRASNRATTDRHDFAETFANPRRTGEMLCRDQIGSSSSARGPSALPRSWDCGTCPPLPGRIQTSTNRRLRLDVRSSGRGLIDNGWYVSWRHDGSRSAEWCGFMSGSRNRIRLSKDGIKSYGQQKLQRWMCAEDALAPRILHFKSSAAPVADSHARSGPPGKPDSIRLFLQKPMLPDTWYWGSSIVHSDS